MIEQVRPSQLSQWLASHPGSVVLDVREPWEVQMASIADSDTLNGHALWHVPMQAVPARCFDWPTHTPVACLCHHGGRSQGVASFLRQRGFTTVANISGGINAWSAEVDARVRRY